jgi:hypothetical protein
MSEGNRRLSQAQPASEQQLEKHIYGISICQARVKVFFSSLTKIDQLVDNGSAGTAMNDVPSCLDQGCQIFLGKWYQNRKK